MLVNALLSGEITVGAFAAVFSSIGMLFAMMRGMVQNEIGSMMANMGMAHNFIRFLDLPEPQGEDATPDYSQGIVAERVSFCYPNAMQPSVKDASLTINAGETVAIVGANGAGKSTLVRLLIGLYAPNEGNVSINGMDTRKTKSAAVFAGISGVFQRFQRYWMTLGENIRISDGGSMVAVDTALEQAGIDINSKSFPQGLETMLSREFMWEGLPGMDLSGGQWQRVALARGLYRMHEVVVLDEPTAAIDPLEESRIYEQFVRISRDKTAIIVTHRLGSTKIADRVVVMDKGKIVEMGSHAELLQKNGVYAGMFNSQAWWYDF
jgi:ATP-binding cassette subfamily B protein